MLLGVRLHKRLWGEFVITKAYLIKITHLVLLRSFKDLDYDPKKSQEKVKAPIRRCVKS